MPSFASKSQALSACFTRPEMKVERVSYDVMTLPPPGAVFESVPGSQPSDGECNASRCSGPSGGSTCAAMKSVRGVHARNAAGMAAGSGTLGLYIEDERQQRAGYFLRDVAHRIHAADLSLAPGCAEPLVKYTEMFTRRASKGQCVNQPYLGCREFAADFRLITVDTPPAAPIGDTRELGWMLHDLDFTHPADLQPRFFNAKMDKGVVQVPI